MKLKPAGKSFRLIILALIATVGLTAAAKADAQTAAETATIAALQKLPPWDFDVYSQGPPETDPTKAFARLGRPDLAIKAIPFKEADVRLSFTDQIWRLVARRRALAGDLAGVQQAKDKITDPYCRADALLTLARAQLRANQPGAARASLYAVSPLLRNKFETRGWLCYTAYLLAKSGDLPAARRLFATIDPFVPNFSATSDFPIPCREDTRSYYMFQAGLGRDALGKLTQSFWSRHQILRDVLGTQDFDLAFEIVNRTTGRASRSGYLVELGLAALGTGKPDVLRKATELARQAALNPSPANLPSGKKPVVKPQSRVRGWLTLAELQEAQGLPEAETSMDQAFAALQQESPQDRLKHWDNANPSKEWFSNVRFIGLSEGASLHYIPPDRRRFISEKAYDAIKTLSSERRVSDLQFLIEGRTPDDGGIPISTLLGAMTTAAREIAAKNKDPNDLRHLIWLAQYYREHGDPVTAAAVVQEILSHKFPQVPQQATMSWLAASGFYEPAVIFVVSGQWRAENGNSLRELALWQSAGSAPTGPPGWILNLHDPRNRTESIIAWAEGLTKPKEPTLRAQEEEFDSLAPWPQPGFGLLQFVSVSEDE